MHSKRALLVAFALLGGAPAPASAQTIYPLARAEILSGARFDFKVECTGTVNPADITVSVNGRAAEDIFRRPALVTVDEEGLGHTAYWIRDATLAEPGIYEVTATAADSSRSV